MIRSCSIGIVILTLGIFSCTQPYPPLETVPSVDLSRYTGVWYEIARLPNTFQENCYCTTAEYQLNDDGTIKVINTCRKDSTTGQVDRVIGKAFVVEGSWNAKLKVQFFWPFRGDYWVIALAPDYSYAVVGTPSRKYLWILSRTPSISDELYSMLVNLSRQKGFDLTRLIRTVHCH